METEKQIEETIIIVKNTVADNAAIDFECDSIMLNGNDLDHVAEQVSQTFYNAGYRKASEVAREIFEEIEKIIDKHYNKHIFGANDLEDEEKEAVINFSDDVTYDIDELKNKYTEERK